VLPSRRADDKKPTRRRSADDKPGRNADAAAEMPPVGGGRRLGSRRVSEVSWRSSTRKSGSIEFEKAIDQRLRRRSKTGVLEKIQHGIDEGSQTEIDVHPLGNAAELTRVQVADVLLGEAKVRLKARPRGGTRRGAFAERIFGWIEPKALGLARDRPRSDPRPRRRRRQDAAAVRALCRRRPARRRPASRSRSDELVLLRGSTMNIVRQQDAPQRAGLRAVALLGLFVAMFTLAGFYMHLHHREVLDDLGHVVDPARTLR
jgi:hypothetical protein